MNLSPKRPVVLGAAVLAVVLGGGAAIAASGAGSPSPTAFLDSVAQHLGISSKKLTDAVKAAEIDQVDAALKAGRITQAQADALKARIESGDTPLLGPGFFGHGFFRHGMGLRGDHLSAAASYLGLTEAQLHTQLEAGKSLAQIAKDQGKSVDGLKNAILTAAQKRLDQAVANGVLTKDQATQLLDRLKSKLDDIVNRTFDDMHDHMPDGMPMGPGMFGGPMGGFHGQRMGGPPAFGTDT